MNKAVNGITEPERISIHGDVIITIKRNSQGISEEKAKVNANPQLPSWVSFGAVWAWAATPSRRLPLRGSRRKLPTRLPTA